jgi:hypothetical protein
LNISFKYAVEGSPIDWFYSTLSKPQLIEANRTESAEFATTDNEFQKTVEKNYRFIEDTVLRLSGEKPHTIKYFSIPDYETCDMEICALAKISNNGTTYTFTNNKQFADFLSDFNFSIETLR